ncbi:MAG: hypothetical protein ACMUIM_10945 [bacterium]
MSRLIAGTPLRLDGITVIPIEKVDVCGRTMKPGYWLYGSKKAEAIVICDLQGIRAFDMQANELSLKRLMREVNGLNVLLKKQADSG